MKMKHFLIVALISATTCVPCASGQSPSEIAIKSESGKLVITAGTAPLATYVFRDTKIHRPYFAHVHAPGGIQVTRNHPPISGKDATDHAEFHPGLWFAFGDLSGADSWRLKARVQHDKFVQEPKAGAGAGTFVVRNSYLSNNGAKVICRETCRYTFLVKPNGYLLLWDSTFMADHDFAFGDQEEMGLGLRVATPITVKAGGRILASEGHKNEKQVRGKTSPWCDYAGKIDGKPAGVLMMQHPKNFRSAWYHARDYGLLVVNHFGRRDLTGGAKSSVVVKRGETLRLRFGALLHAGAKIDLAASYKDYLMETK
ncbi:MAG: PmoA family protein [Planctomycetes bacterium]|nr:PmoA family protein [Planctomycetota bacterium]